MWWRILIPTWRFFDQTGTIPDLYVDRGQGWEKIDLPLRNSWWSLFFNPLGNMAHARNNLYERLLAESQDSKSVSNLVSYRLVEDIARHYVDGSPVHHPFRFKLRLGDQDVLTSSTGTP